MIWVVTLLRSKVYCSTTTEATSARYASTRSPEQRALQPGAEQHCSRGPAGTSAAEQLLPAKSDVTPAGRTALQQGLAAVDGGWMYRCRCRERSWRSGFSSRMTPPAGRTGETMERHLSREKPSQREIADLLLPYRPQ